MYRGMNDDGWKSEETVQQEVAPVQAGSPGSSLWLPLSWLGQLKIVTASTAEANLCRWEVCRAAVPATNAEMHADTHTHTLAH